MVASAPGQGSGSHLFLVTYSCHASYCQSSAHGSLDASHIANGNPRRHRSRLRTAPHRDFLTRSPPFSGSNSRRTWSPETSAEQPYAAATAASRASWASASPCACVLSLTPLDHTSRPHGRADLRSELRLPGHRRGGHDLMVRFRRHGALPARARHVEAEVESSPLQQPQPVAEPVVAPVLRRPDADARRSDEAARRGSPYAFARALL